MHDLLNNCGSITGVHTAMGAETSVDAQYL